jgi:hypothetical protein
MAWPVTSSAQQQTRTANIAHFSYLKKNDTEAKFGLAASEVVQIERKLPPVQPTLVGRLSCSLISEIEPSLCKRWLPAAADASDGNP